MAIARRVKEGVGAMSEGSPSDAIVSLNLRVILFNKRLLHIELHQDGGETALIFVGRMIPLFLSILELKA